MQSPVRISRCLLLASTALVCAGQAAAQHAGDINPSVVPAGPDLGMIVTNDILPGGVLADDVRVFAADFGDSGFPEFTANPGFDALPGTFTPGTRLGFHAPQGFFRFDGTGLVPVTTERLNVKFLTLQVTVGAAPSDGFDLAVQSNGGFHRHLSYTVLDTVAPLPAPGIYVLPMTLYSTDPAVLESEVFYKVFDYGAGPLQQDLAMAWIEANLLASSCPADLDDDGAVGPGDLAIALGQWGGEGTADLDADGFVGPGDLAILLGAWGSCP
jgi:hypothetical protein